MTVSLIALTLHGEIRHFTARMDTLEAALEAVNAIATTGDTLLRVDLLDENNVLSLPPSAFDGQPIGLPMQNLEKEWTQLLLLPSTLQQSVADLLRQQRDAQETYIGRLETAIARLKLHLLDAQDRLVELVQIGIISRLTMNVERYESLHKIAVRRRETIATQLRKIAHP